MAVTRKVMMMMSAMSVKVMTKNTMETVAVKVMMKLTCLETLVATMMMKMKAMKAITVTMITYGSTTNHDRKIRISSDMNHHYISSSNICITLLFLPLSR